MIKRQSVLRSRFVWEGVGQPVQVVEREVELPWREADWSGLSEGEQEERLEAELARDRAAGFVLGEAPLMRLTLLRLGTESYELIWSHHHLVLDGWSMSVLLREVTAYYEGYWRGEEMELGRSRSYGEYIRWVRGQDLGAAEQYWREQLRGFRAATRLGIESDGAVKQSESYAEQQLWLDQSIYEQLDQMGRQQQVTLNTIVQGAWSVLLSRYSGETDVVFGATVSGRPVELLGVETMVGVFINTLPVRVRVDGQQRVADWLRQLQAEQLEARQYEYSPLVAVQSWSEVAAGEPLFETLFVFENYPLELSMKQLGLEISRMRVSEQVNYPLTIMVIPGQMQLRVYYDRRRFAAAAIERMLQHLEVLLEGMAAGAELSVAELPLLTVSERTQLLAYSKPQPVRYPAQLCLHQLFEAQAQRTPEAVAVVLDDQSLSYSELNARANQLGHYLRRLGVGPEVQVGLLLHRSLDLIVALLATLKAGGSYLPLDPSYPPERLCFMLQDAQVQVVLTEEELVEQVAQHSGQMVLIDRQWQSIATESAENPGLKLYGDNLAYVIYTSGSTGTPKGAMNTHAAIYNRLCWMQEAYGLTAADSVLQKTPYSFDVSVWEFFWPFMTGARLVLARPGGHRDSAYLVQLIKQEQITTLHFVPAMLQVFLEEPGVEECTSLRRVICSGEALSRELQDRFFARLSRVELHNLYGPTEAAVDVTAWACKPNGSHTGVPIGRPIANTCIYLLDEYQQLVPLGVPGELYIGGVQLARGYHKRAALTAERFVPDPFSDTPGARLYRTGDLARYLSDGSIEYLCRLDHQVKVRGYRIELGEVEAVLREHAAVKEAVVVTREDQTGNKELIAYIVASEALTRDELRTFLEQRLPEYMVPSAFVMLDALPLTVSGKVDRRALPVPDLLRLELEDDFTAPENLVEEVLAEIWAEVLGVELIGVHTNFFALGGHSLRVIKVVSRVREVFDIELPMQACFQSPTIRSLGAVITRMMEEKGVRFESDSDQLMRELEQMSEAEINELLTDHK